MASSVALAISVILVVLAAWYYRLYVYPPVSAGYGLYVGGAVAVAAVLLSVWTMLAAWSDRRRSPMSGFVEPVALTGERWVTLEPLTREHLPEIEALAADGELGRLWFTGAPKAGAAGDWVDDAAGAAEPRHRPDVRGARAATATLVGSSSYLNVDGANRRLEIGNTWYAASARRTGVNTETKLLMLGHAFDELGCVAVEFRTHFFNSASRAAIERLGAKLDGMLRSHQVLPDGSRRDTVVYSILDIEWPAVRNNLVFRLDRHG